MKLLHTADWHLGKRLERFERMAEQAEVLEEIVAIAEREEVDAILIAGDLYDTFNPPTEATEIFYRTLKRLAQDGKRAVIAIAGNHDSPDRIEAPDPLARECGIIFTGYPHSEVRPFELESGLKVLRTDQGFLELKLPEQEIPLRLLLTPYANEARLKRDLGVTDPETAFRVALEAHWKNLAEKYCDDKGVNLLMSHLFMVKKGAQVPDEPDDERPINVGGAQLVYSENLPRQIQYVALGHLHRFQTVDSEPCPVVYSGSPLEYSFAEAEQQKHVVLIDIEPGEPVNFNKIPLNGGRKLVRRTFEDVDEAVHWLQENPEVIVELTIVSDDYLTALDRKRITSAHDRIIGPIPIVKGKNQFEKGEDAAINLQQSMEELFLDYFKYKFGQEANPEIVSLFREIRGQEVEE